VSKRKAMSSYVDRLDRPGPKRLLALDGGGIRGVIALEVLRKLEDSLRVSLGAGSDFVLSDFFDYIGGTSTGAIIATALSLGTPVAEVQRQYMEGTQTMFRMAAFYKQALAKHTDTEIGKMLRSVFGEHTTFGDEKLKTLLLLVMRNATTDSPWPVSNNPRAKYCDRSRDDCNLDLPLWRLVRASTAAPTFFPPEVVRVGSTDYIFVDGAVTMYNNPAFLLFLMATMPEYRLEWPTGEDNLLLVSVGTGTAAQSNGTLKTSQMTLLYNAAQLPAALIYAASNEQDMLCRVAGRCRFGNALDRELGDLISPDNAGIFGERKFTYVRYNPDLSTEGLAALGVHGIESRHVQRLDSIAHIQDMATVGRAYARNVSLDHLGSFAS
jgi:patatin-like phospholipase/acyl hydrolase